MIKTKMDKFQLSNNLEEYSDLDMNNIRMTYNNSRNHIDAIKQQLTSEIDKFYDIFVRRDPARPLYNY